MRKFWQNKELRNLAFVGVALVMAVALCIANIVVLNLFAIIVSLMLIVFMCLALGYSYSKYEANCGVEQMSTGKQEVSEFMSQGLIETTDKDLNKL